VEPRRHGQMSIAFQFRTYCPYPKGQQGHISYTKPGKLISRVHEPFPSGSSIWLLKIERYENPTMLRVDKKKRTQSGYKIGMVYI